MAKSLSPALQEFRKSIRCANCDSPFEASDSQAFRAYYQKSDVYCSPVCKSQGMGRKISKQRAKKPQMYGPCPTCKKKFPSKDHRVYCSLPCWLASPEFKAMLAENSKKGNEAYKRKCEDERPICPVCKINKVKPGRKFCSKKCWRQSFAELFDYQIANPCTLEELQGFDEYLSQEELPCLVEGCDWKGKHLSVHLNHAHGIKAADFKRAVGFNLTTGLVAPEMKEKLGERPGNGMTKEEFQARVRLANTGKNHSRYISKENKEHRQKYWALRRAMKELAEAEKGDH